MDRKLEKYLKNPARLRQQLHLAGVHWDEGASVDLLPAAVLVLLQPQPRDGPQLWFIRRSSELRKHAGQIAFPGGKRDPEDDSLWQTALREAEEEIGLNPAGVEALGQLPSIATPSGYVIHPYVAWNHGSPPPCPPNPEVDQVFSLCLYQLALRGPEGDGFPSPYGRIWGATAWILYQYLEILKLKPA